MRDIHAHDAGAEEPRTDPDRMLSRRSPTDRSESGLVSRDYQPRMGGPELVASWRLGAPPTQTELGDVDWKITETEYVTLQTNIFTHPYVTGINFAPAYLIVCGRGHVDSADETLSIELSNSHLSGKPYEIEIELTNTEHRPFVSPLVEFAPDRPDYEGKPWGSRIPEYVLSAKVSGGSASLDPGTNVQLWSE